MSKEKIIKDLVRYLKRTPKNKRVSWLKDGEKWLDDYYKKKK